MSAADEAYAEAERLIARAKRSRAEKLDLDRPETRALTRLPPGIAALDKLQILDLSDTQITDLAPLAGLTGLTRLLLTNTPVTDLAPLAGLTGLTELSLSSTQVANLAPLAGLTGLTWLSLGNSAALDLRPLLGLRALVEAPDLGGLTFAGTAAARADPRIAEIAAIKDPATRARTLFDYLETWVPPQTGVPQSPANADPAPPALPEPKPAPLEIAVEGGRLVLAGGGSGLPSSDANTRAEQGWRALKDYRESFGEGFNVGNYAPLPAVLKAFDRALGDAYDARRQIAMGMHGQRIIGLAFDAGFVENLPTGAETELKGFAAAISTFVNRFPDWLEYQAEAEAAEPAAARAVEERQAFQELENVIAEAETADDAVKAEYHDEVFAGTQTGASEVEAKGLVASTRELTRVLAETAMAEVKKGSRVRAFTSQMRKTGETEFPKAAYWAGGIGFNMLRRMSPGLRRLSLRFPKQLGWVDSILDYLFDPQR